uniref:RNA-directed RNA polymerase n=3 Tax=Wuchereria bancrofti TaxID=6293 RepID=A0AAF5PSN0_WUCBA
MELRTGAITQSTHLKVILNDCNVKIVNILMKLLSQQLGWEDLFGRRVKVCRTITKRQMGENDYGESWIELNLEVISRHWHLDLLPLAMRFQIIIDSLHFVGSCNAVLQAANKQMFLEDCIAAHMFLPLEAFHFGSLLKGQFLSHFSRVACLGTALEQLRSLNVLRALRNCPAIVDPMFVDFEHDRDIFIVRFAILDGGFRSKNNENSKITNTSPIPGSAIALKVRYNSIRRVLVDLRVKLPNGARGRRIYFHLNYPPEIRKYQRKTEDDEDKIGSDGNRWRSIPENNDDKRDNCAAINESPYFCLQLRQHVSDHTLYQLLSRLRVRAVLSIEFANLKFRYLSVFDYVDAPVRFIGCDYRPYACDEVIISKERNYELPFSRVDPACEKKIRDCDVFGLEYLIAALLSRGAVVKDQILIDKRTRDAFVDMILQRFKDNEELTLEALERLINMIDESKQTPCLFTSFQKIRNTLGGQKDILEEIYHDNKREGYQRVRKVIITPTRIILVVPELLMGNRVLRTFDKDGNGALRIQFRDDDGTPLRVNTVGLFLIQTTTFNTLSRGIYIGDRHFVYLGSSNSQMRDNGCYFYDDGKGGQAHKIREQLGKFDSCNIPKMMSRMGQCFTQAKRCTVILKRQKYNKTYDIIGGRDTNQASYTFSDGVGKVSKEFAEKIAFDIGLGTSVPSCYQIRHRGIKGVLSVDPNLDQRKQWTLANNIVDNNRMTNKQNDLAVVFRPSQDKFKAPRDEYIEIVKYSSPTPVCLNRPMISILDQVSGMQGFSVHERIKKRIHDLLDVHLTQLADMLMNEDKCRERLNELPLRVNVSRLTLARGFALTQEPFFRSLLRAHIKCTLKKLIAKIQIQIPPHLGRSMFGVMDETGQLQWGQIFVQCTRNIWLKTPSQSAAKIILKGKVMLTKNPCIVAGDVRVFEAVDIPELHHLVDVVVFPQHGPRPHPDEMAGSDLDGDEYSVIWDQKLIFEHNEPPLDFTKSTSGNKIIDEAQVDLEMRKFFVNYIKQDSIGSISNAFLVNADLYGITSEVCINIAKKHSKAVDFPKTGDAPAPLTRQWTRDKNGNMLPPERAERWPDFMCKNHEPSYISSRLVGQLYRRIRLLDDALNLTIVMEENIPIMLDPDLEYPGWERYQNIAKSQFDSYHAYIRSIMENYGIEDEGQLFSGFISAIRNRINDRDTDDMSFYNTNHIIEKKVSAVFKAYRHRFFDEFGGFLENTLPDHDDKQNGNVQERRICVYASSDMKQKASAYYILCYRNASLDKSCRTLSFGWLVWDILCQIKQEVRMIRGKSIVQSLDPLGESASEFIKNYCEANAEDMKWTLAYVMKTKQVARILEPYCSRYKGLEDLFYILIKWATLHELLKEPLKAVHICLLLIQFGLGCYADDKNIMQVQFLEETKEVVDKNSHLVCNLHSLVGGIGVCLLKFFKFLSSRTIQTLKMLNFRNVGYRSLLIRGQWIKLNEAALKTFFSISLTGRLDHVTLTGYGNMNDKSFNRKIFGTIEIEPFMIELPVESPIHLAKFREKIHKHCGVKYLQMRRIAHRKKDRVIVSAVGTLESLHRLRDLLSIRPSVNSYANYKENNDIISRLIVERLEKLN